MFTLMATSEIASASPLKRLLNRHPLLAYFVLAYAGAWLALLPVLLAQNGLGLLPFTVPDVLALLSFVLLASFAGPTLAAFIVTAATSGKDGVRQLLGRYLLWRVGIPWYLLALFGFLILFLLSVSLSLGAAPLNILLQQWPLLLSSFLPNMLVFALLGVLGEEPGWRGFALPRLQRQYGPLLGSLILGTLHGLWHLPAFFVTGALAPFTFSLFLTFVLTAVASTIFYTWIYNNTQGSILIAILTHAASNAASGFVNQLAPTSPALNGDWGNVIVVGLWALLIIVFTRGRLGYKST